MSPLFCAECLPVDGGPRLLYGATIFFLRLGIRAVFFIPQKCWPCANGLKREEK